VIGHILSKLLLIADLITVKGHPIPPAGSW